MQNFPQQFQTPLSQKQKTFSGFFIQTPASKKQNTFSGLFNAFMKYAWNLEHFQKKDEYPSLIISEIIDAKRRG